MTSRYGYYDHLPREVRVDFGTCDGMKIYTVDDKNDQNNTFGLYNKHLKGFRAYLSKYGDYIYIYENERLSVNNFFKKNNIKCIKEIDESIKQFIQDKLDKSEKKHQKKLEEVRQEHLQSKAEQRKINAKNEEKHQRSENRLNIIEPTVRRSKRKQNQVCIRKVKEAIRKGEKRKGILPKLKKSSINPEILKRYNHLFKFTDAGEYLSAKSKYVEITKNHKHIDQEVHLELGRVAGIE